MLNLFSYVHIYEIKTVGKALPGTSQKINKKLAGNFQPNFFERPNSESKSQTNLQQKVGKKNRGGGEVFNQEYAIGNEDGKVNLNQETTLDIRDRISQKAHEPHTTTFRYKGLDYPIIINETVRYLAKHMLNHNSKNGFTSVTLSGKSGSGKSTFSLTLAHELHHMAEKQFGTTYAINWFRKKEMESIDKIIQTLEKGINRILVFEDASFLFNKMHGGEEEEIMQQLTYIRHTLQAKVIIMIQTHYQKALSKFFRDGDFVIVTSMTNEERDNYYRLFGSDSKRILSAFKTKYYSMNVDNYYHSNVGTTLTYKYVTQEPFKVALVSDMGRLHFVNYYKTECPQCAPNFDRSVVQVALDSATFKDFFRTMIMKYRDSERSTNPARVLLALRYHLYYKNGIDQLMSKERAITHKLVSYFSEHQDDYQSMLDQLGTGKSLEGVFREAGLISKKVSKQELAVIRRAEKKQARKLKRALAAGSNQPIAPMIGDRSGLASDPLNQNQDVYNNEDGKDSANNIADSVQGDSEE